MEAAPRIELGNKGFADLCLTAWLCRHIKLERETRFELATPALARRCSTAELFPHVHGASGQNRTVDTRIFSPLLYRLSYRGIHKWRPRSDLNWRSSPWQGDMLTATPRGRVLTCVSYLIIITWPGNECKYFFQNFYKKYIKYNRIHSKI